jgi:acid phosphatase (class A)
MKPILILILFFTTVKTVIAQQVNKKSLAPVSWGHYKKLAAISVQPQKNEEHVDSLHYELNAKHKRVTDLFATEVFGNGRTRTPFYLTGKEQFTISPPPANSSLQTKAELNYLLQLQAQRTEEDTRASKFYAGVYYRTYVKPEDADYKTMRRNLFHIGRSIGTWFNADSLPATAILVEKVWKDAEFLIWKYKNYYLRIRPYKLENSLQNLEETDWAAYPSGHATNSYVNAYLFAELIPEFNAFFLKDAYDMAHSREIIGVHYPSDSESGRVLAYELIQRLKQNESFKKDFAAAKKEIEKVKNIKGF